VVVNLNQTNLVLLWRPTAVPSININYSITVSLHVLFSTVQKTQGVLACDPKQVTFCTNITGLIC